MAITTLSRGPMEMRAPRLYRKLKSLHGAAKAVEIMLDASRGNKYSINWIKAVRRLSL